MSNNFLNLENLINKQPFQKRSNKSVLTGQRGRPRKPNMVGFHGKIDRCLKVRCQRYVKQSAYHSSLSSLIGESLKYFLDAKEAD